LGIDCATPEAVLFLDEAELAACLIRDWLQRVWSERWWWRELLGSLSVTDWLHRHVVVRADVFAPAMELLSERGLAPAWCSKLESGWVTQALKAIEASYGVSTAGSHQFRARKRHAPPLRASGGEAARVECSRELRTLQALLRIVPEVAALTLSSERLQLLAVALAIRRDLAWARSAECAAGLLALHESADTRARPEVRQETTPARELETSLQSGPESSPSGDSAHECRPPMNAAPSAALADAPASAENGASPWREGPASIPLLAAVPQQSRDESQLESAGHEEARKPEGPFTVQAPPLVPPGADSAPQGDRSEPPQQLADGVFTQFGGAFYLLNVALALGLYGDFTMPRYKALDLSPWDWLAMVGARWFGDEFRKDQVWKVLAELAGHAPRRRPERGFKPPKRKSVKRWFAAMSAQLVARLMAALGSQDPKTIPDLVCRYPAHIYMSASAVDVHLSLDDLPISLRIGGLDRDPGWIPAAGRSVRFHFK